MQSREIVEQREKIEALGGRIEDVPEAVLASGEYTLITFPNGYGASIIRGYGSYGYESGLFELGFKKFDGTNWRLTTPKGYDDQVEGWLTVEDVLELLEKISKYADRT